MLGGCVACDRGVNGDRRRGGGAWGDWGVRVFGGGGDGAWVIGRSGVFRL